MTANDTQRAVARLRQPLPEPWRPAPRLVHTDTENLDGVAFCDVAASYHEADAACGHCEVIDTYNPRVAERIVALLRATEPIAAHLNALNAWGHAPRQPENGGDWSCRACGDLGQMPEQCPAWSASRIVWAINGTEATTS